MKRLLFLPVLFLTLLVGNAAFSADFQKGYDAYNEEPRRKQRGIGDLS